MTFLRFMAGPGGRIIRATLIVVGVSLGGGWVALAVFGFLPIATAVLDLCPVNLLRRVPVGGKDFRDATCPR